MTSVGSPSTFVVVAARGAAAAADAFPFPPSFPD
jgi:hypothetical protein